MTGIAIRRPYPVLDREGIEKIHAAAMQGLERVGVRIGTARGRRLLKEAGAHVDGRTNVVKFPPALIQECVRKTAKRVVLYGRDSSQDADLDLKHVHICNDGNGAMAIDYDTGERRSSVADDLMRSARVSNALDNLHVYWPMTTSMDIDARIRSLVDYKISFLNTDKHVQVCTTVSEIAARELVAMASAVVGGEKELRRRPIVSSVSTTIAPLQQEGGNIDAALVLGEAGVPVALFTMPTPGASGPVTLAGSLTVAAMEFLSGLAMCQLANPGAPVIWGNGIAPLDMKTTTRGGGGPEHGLDGAAITQLAHHYGVPSLCGGFDSTASVMGTQAAIETFASGMSLVLGGADLIVGIGLIEDARTLSLEKLVIDDEIINMLRRIADGIVVNDETIALDVIERVGAGGTFLGQRHTMQHLREEHFMPKLLDRRSYDVWLKDGAKSIEQRAHAKVLEALAEPVPHPLEPDVVKELDEIIHRAARTPLAAA